jgi:hypothetical protein
MRVSTASNWRSDARLVIAGTALLVVLFYLLVSNTFFRIGFPLDDAWIHLTYARNFAEHGEWAFRLGESSAASTSPLWTFLLSIGFLLKLAPYIWTYFLGWLTLTLLGIQAENTARKLVTSYTSRIPWVGLFIVTAWHLTWSAVSGMETLLHGYVILIVLCMLMEGSRRYLALGLLVGISIWIRPDGLTLLGPILFTAIFIEPALKSRNVAIVKVLIGVGALFVPYLLFNLALSGNPMPNTFYAKQAEYQAFWLSKTLSARLTEYLFPIFVSPFLVLIPGLVIWIRRMIQSRNVGAISGMIWLVGYIGIYFTRLPAYQHGRYIIPAFAILYLWGVLGTADYLNSGSLAGYKSTLALLWKTMIFAVSVLFIWMGANTYARDVALIESEMVDTAKWTQQNLPPDALLAVHDIGAMGYFDRHQIIDLAGLISPNVIEFIRDETKLAEYLNQSGANYVVTFPVFYPQLLADRQLIFSTRSPYTLELGEQNMGVYLWK